MSAHLLFGATLATSNLPDEPVKIGGRLVAFDGLQTLQRYEHTIREVCGNH